MKKIQKIILFVVAAALVAGTIVILFYNNSTPVMYNKQLDLGNKYLEEQDYEQAKVAYEQAIEIDPMSTEAYIGLAETYIRMSEFDMALEIAKKGYELTSDERLAAYIEMLESGNISRSDGLEMKRTYYDENGAVMFWHEFTYDKENRKNSVSHYNASHNFVSSVELLYDNEGKPITSYTFSGNNGELTSYNLYYENGLLVSQISNGDEPRWMLYEYDGNGNTRKRINGYGKEMGDMTYCTSISIFEYNDENRRIKEDVFNNYNELMHSFTWEYDENGKTEKYSKYNSDGKLEWLQVYEGDVTYRYDGDSNLLEYSVSE